MKNRNMKKKEKIVRNTAKKEALTIKSKDWQGAWSIKAPIKHAHSGQDSIGSLGFTHSAAHWHFNMLPIAYLMLIQRSSGADAGAGASVGLGFGATQRPESTSRYNRGASMFCFF